MQTLNYLAYGSNLHPRRLQQRVPSAQVIGTVGLMGWQLRFHKLGKDASAKCNILQTGKTGDVVYAAVYQMRASDKHMLDQVEGLNRGYELAQIDLAGVGSVFFYTAEDHYIDDQLLPFDWYKKLVIAGGRYHAFPDNYLDEINRIGVMRDSDEARQLHHLAILNMT